MLIYSGVFFISDSVGEQLITLEMSCHACLLLAQSAELQTKKATLTMMMSLRVHGTREFIIKNTDLHFPSNKMFKTGYS